MAEDKSSEVASNMWVVLSVLDYVDVFMDSENTGSTGWLSWNTCLLGSVSHNTHGRELE